MNTSTKKIVACVSSVVVALAIVAVIVLAALTGFNFNQMSEIDFNADINESLTADMVSFEFSEMTSEQGIMLSSGEATAAALNFASRTLTATVLPEDSNNKLVDWTMSWQYTNEEFEQANSVEEYASLTSEGDGSNVATITIKKAFANHPILIKVTTRDGGLTATCIVKYVGVPTVMDIDTSALNDGDVLANSTTTLNLSFNNDYGLVTDEYVSDYARFSVSVVANGTFKVRRMFANMVMNNMTEHDINLADVADLSNLTAKVENGKLVITSTKSVTSYYINNSVVDDGGTGLGGVTDITTYLSGAENCYWSITVTDNYSGVSKTINVGIYSNNTSVALSSSELVF